MVDHCLALILRAVYFVDSLALAALLFFGRRQLRWCDRLALRPIAFAMGIVSAWGIFSHHLLTMGGLDEPLLRVLFHGATPPVIAWGIFASNRRLPDDLLGGCAVLGVLVSEVIAVHGWHTSPEVMATALAGLWFAWAAIAFCGLFFRRRQGVRLHEPFAGLFVASMPPTAVGFIAWGVHPTGYAIAQGIGVLFASALGIMVTAALWMIRSPRTRTRSGFWRSWPRPRS